MTPHIIVPVKLGYAIHTGADKISVLPEVGAAYAIGFPSARHTGQGDAMLPAASAQNNSTFAGIAQFNLLYRLNDRYSFTCGPSLQYMLTSILVNGQPYNCSLLFNAGMRCKLTHRKTHKRPVKNAKTGNNGSY